MKTDKEFKNEVYARASKERTRIKKRNRVIMTAVPCFVIALTAATAAVYHSTSFSMKDAMPAEQPINAENYVQTEGIPEGYKSAPLTSEDQECYQQPDIATDISSGSVKSGSSVVPTENHGASVTTVDGDKKGDFDRLNCDFRAFPDKKGEKSNGTPDAIVISNREKLEFNSYSGKSKKTEFMCSTESVYLSDSDAVGFMKPYKNGRFAFAALLPDEDVNIDDYIASLSGEKLMKIFSSAKKNEEVDVKMPKFKAEYSTQLIDTLKKMGIEDAFDRKSADFSSLIDKNDGAYIGTVMHKTFIEVDQEGTRAAAATLVGISKMSMPAINPVCLNRPFVYMIVDTETNLPLFIGVQTEI